MMDKFASLRLEDPGVFPVRVIDIQATLDSSSVTGGVVFTEPKDWQFHTISHTWSLHIRRLSEEIGRRVASHSTPLHYNQAFLHAMLHHQPGYSHLLEFLAMIQADGAARVWCDALCINQLDDGEKSHEILHMGAFYFHSLGCYTVAHGFGGGFSLTVDRHAQQLHDGHGEDEKHAASILAMPRWFSRVWTLQEWCLPRRLTFVVELDRSYFHRLVREVREWHEFGECDCKGCNMSDLWHWGSRDGSSKRTADMRGVEDVDEEEFWKILQRSGYKCVGGRFHKFNDTNPHEMSTNRDGKSLYWVDRAPYILLLAYCMDEEIKSESVDQIWIDYDAVWKDGYPGIVRAISVRNCSDGHDEDRVLSVLALLGIEGKLQQLRTGESLDQQILQMADAMAVWNLQGLITMCVAFFEPYDSPLRLSWAPHFRARAGSLGAYCYVLEAEKLDHGSFQHAVGRVSVSARGLSLTCHMLKGRLVPHREHTKECTSGVCCYTCNDHRTAEFNSFALQIASNCAGHVYGFTSFNSDGRLQLLAGDVSQRNGPRFHSSYYFQGRMLFDIDLTLFGDAEKFPSNIQLNVWLLLLGTYDKKLPQKLAARTVLVFMVCVGSRENFHKVGSVYMFPTFTKDARSSTLHLDLFDYAYCTIGGFSKQEWSKWTLEQLNVSRWWNHT